VGLGYGWLLRAVYGAMAVGSAALGRLFVPSAGRDAAAAVTAVAAVAALGVSVARRKAGVRGERARRQRRAERVAAMVGGSGAQGASAAAGARHGGGVREFPPVLDVLAPVVGALGLVAAAFDAGGPAAVAVVRTVVGAAFLGAVSDAMLLGHWYLVQPGLGREPLVELVHWVGGLWPLEVAALVWPPGMPAVLSGSIDDGWGGMLGWFWAACALATLVLAAATRAALRERAYSAVMAATGLLYLAILTAFGTDLIARAVLAS
jgi:hypothetical protein